MVFRSKPDEEEMQRIHSEAETLIKNIDREFEKLNLDYTNTKNFSNVLKNKDITTKVKAYRMILGYHKILSNIIYYYRPHLENKNNTKGKDIMDAFYKITIAMDTLEIDNKKYF